jgi:hypothetical protein
MQKDIQGLYYQGGLVAITYSESIKIIFDLDAIPKRFCVDEDHPAIGFSIVDINGIQHIYELNNRKFYSELMKLED